MSNESVVTQWREGRTGLLWVRDIGTEKHTIHLRARNFSNGWEWAAWYLEGGKAEGQTPDGELASTKSAATEAGYALLKRLESMPEEESA